MEYRYFALTTSGYPVGRPVAVVRVSTTNPAHVERYRPSHGWTPGDPRDREWLVNVPITEGHANSMLDVLVNDDLDEWDPYNPVTLMFVREGYGEERHFYAIETDEHPLDDPLTVVRHHLLTRTEVSFTRDLCWVRGPVAGTRARITEEQADRFEEIQARRAFGDADVRYFAVVNALYPDAEDPCVVARERVDENGVLCGEHFGPDREWVAADTVLRVRHLFRAGGLVPITEEKAGLLAEVWTPRPKDVRHFARLDEKGGISRLARLWVDGGLLHEEELNDDADWTSTKCFLSGPQQHTEVDQATADRHTRSMERRHSEDGPEDGLFTYFAIVEYGVRDPFTAHDLVRAWTSVHGTEMEQSFHPRDDKWRSCMTLFEIECGRDESRALPITADDAERLRQAWLARVAENG